MPDKVIKVKNQKNPRRFNQLVTLITTTETDRMNMDERTKDPVLANVPAVPMI